MTPTPTMREALERLAGEVERCEHGPDLISIAAAIRRAALAEAEATGEVCPNCNDANQYGDYEGPTCQVCGGTGRIAAPSAPASGGEPV